jgi:hypothetical protein
MKRRFSIAPIQRVGSQRKHPADFDFVLRRPCALCARIGWRDAYSDSMAGRGYVLVPAGAFAYRIVVTKESAISANEFPPGFYFLLRRSVHYRLVQTNRSSSPLVRRVGGVPCASSSAVRGTRADGAGRPCWHSRRRLRLRLARVMGGASASRPSCVHAEAPACRLAVTMKQNLSTSEVSGKSL